MNANQAETSAPRAIDPARRARYSLKSSQELVKRIIVIPMPKISPNIRPVNLSGKREQYAYIDSNVKKIPKKILIKRAF